MKFKHILLVFLSAFFLRLLLFVFVRNINPDGIWVFDSYAYWQSALNLYQYNVFSISYTEILQPEYFRTPLYPLLILIFIFEGSGGNGVIVCQLFLSSFTCVLISLTAFEIFKKSSVAIIAGIILALDVTSIVFCQLVLTETFFSFLLAAFIYLLILFIKRKQLRFLIIAAVVHGLLLLCRPIALFTLAFPIMYFLLHFSSLKLKLKYSVIYLLIFTLPLVPWLVRNKNHFGDYFISTIGSFVLLNYHAASIVSEKNNIPFNEAQTLVRTNAVKEFKGNAETEPVAFAEKSRQNAFKIISDNKGIFIKQHFSGVFSILFKPVRGYIDNLLGYTKGYQTASASAFPVSKSTIRIVKQLSSKLSLSLVIWQLLALLIIYIGFLKGIFIWMKQSDYLMLFLFLIIIFYFSNMTVPPFNEARFRLPIMPFLAIISALGLDSFLGKKKYN